MPYVKCISGHTSACAVQRYLERGGRALATDFLNIDAPVSGVRDGLEDHGRIDWWREMDRTRAAFGNDAAWNGRRARTWKHYILSPNPEDGIELPRLRRLATAWAKENFGDYEVAIVEPCQYNGQRNLRFFMRSASPLDRTQGLSRNARRTPASPLPARDLLWTYAGGSGCSTTRLNSCALCLVVDASKRRLW